MNFLPNLKHLALTILSVLLLASCAHDRAEEEITPTEPSLCYITLTISTAGNNTRSTHQDQTNQGEYDNGKDVDWENYINLRGGDFRFLLFRADDANPNNETFITEVNTSNGLLISPDDTDNPYNPNSPQLYRVIGSVLASDFDDVTAYKAVFVGNWSNYPTPNSATTITQYTANATYTYHSPTFTWQLGPDNLIPMFGVTNTLRNQEGHYHIQPGQRTDIGTIHLLRAMAKIEVTSGEGEDLGDIKSVKLVRYNETGYCAPHDITSQSQYFDAAGNYPDPSGYIYDNDFIKTPSVKSGVINTGEIDFQCKEPTTSGGKRVYTIYIPEYINEQPDSHEKADDACHLEIQFDDDSRTFTLDFKSTQNNLPYSNYQEGDYYNLLRNTYYKYTVSRRSYEINIEVELIPYWEVTLEPKFGLD